MHDVEVKSCFVSKLHHFLDLSEQEKQALAGFEKKERHLERHEVLHRQGDPADEIFVVKSGWLYGSRHLKGGQRQVVELRHPGDLCGMHDLILQSRSHALVALDSSVVCPLPLYCLRDLTSSAPRVSMLINALASLDQVLLMDLLQSIAHTPASDRLLHLLLQLFHRLRINNADMYRTFRLPMNQTLIGDMLGLTNVTVSKSFAELERWGMIKRGRETVTLVNLEGAVARLNYCDRFAELDLEWLKSETV